MTPTDSGPPVVVYVVARYPDGRVETLQFTGNVDIELRRSSILYPDGTVINSEDAAVRADHLERLTMSPEERQQLT